MDDAEIDTSFACAATICQFTRFDRPTLDVSIDQRGWADWRVSMSDLSSFRSRVVDLRICADMSGAARLANPDGSPRLRNVMCVPPVGVSCQVYVVSIGKGCGAAKPRASAMPTLKSGGQVRDERLEGRYLGARRGWRARSVVAVVGLGRIGSHMASLLQPMGRSCAEVRSLT